MPRQPAGAKRHRIPGPPRSRSAFFSPDLSRSLQRTQAVTPALRRPLTPIRRGPIVRRGPLPTGRRAPPTPVRPGPADPRMHPARHHRPVRHAPPPRCSSRPATTLASRPPGRFHSGRQPEQRPPHRSASGQIPRSPQRSPQQQRPVPRRRHRPRPGRPPGRPPLRRQPSRPLLRAPGPVGSPQPPI